MATGPIDATFFEDAQGPYAATVFHSWLLLVRGRIRRTGPEGLSLRATGCWELGGVRQLWLDQGLVGVQQMLDDSHPVTAAVGAPVEDRRAGSAGGMGQRRRVLVHASGFRMSPYADIKPAGVDIKQGAPTRETPPTAPGRENDGQTGDDRAGAPAKLWHSSPGSSGW